VLFSSGATRALHLWSVFCFAGCNAFADQGELPPPPPSGSGGSFGDFSGDAGFGAVLSVDGGTEAPCTPVDTAQPTFADQVVAGPTLAARELYSWVSDEDAAALRTEKNLFRQSAGTGAPFTMLVGPIYATADETMLAHALSAAFQMGRYAWPEPWAIRMGWPGHDPGGNLLRIVLKPDAYVAVLEPGTLMVIDGQERPVAAADALAHPERIGAIFFDTSSPGCGGGSGYREFLVGNLAAIQEWSFGTQSALDRLNSNIRQLTRFLNNIRSCPNSADEPIWAQNALCTWSDPLGSLPLGAAGAPGTADSGVGSVGGSGFEPTPLPGIGTEELSYDQALALPNANYFTAPAPIAAIIETLTGDLFKPDPWIVTPGSP